MTLVLDTSFVVGYYEAGTEQQRAAERWYLGADDDFVTTPLAVAEMDYLVSRRGGAAARQALWGDFRSRAWQVRWWADAMDETLQIAGLRPELGLVDASLVALAHRLRTDRIATFDHRHFRTLETRSGKPFTILPADA
jgi:predicted nucleic acid-binding protein